MRMMDKKLSLLAGKILLYLAENPTVSSFDIFNSVLHPIQDYINSHETG